MKVPALKISQWGYGKGAKEQTLYITAIPAKNLFNSDIDRWSKDNREGYQRPPEESRLKPAKGSVVRYLLDEMGVFPTSVLLNVRGSLSFKEETKLTDKITLGQLTIPENEKLVIIDGQHRLEAIKRAVKQKQELEDYPVPVSITNLKDKFEEMLLFYIVNSRQRRIKTELAYRQLQTMYERVKIKDQYKWLEEAILGKTQERQAIAAFIVDYLAEDEDSPFCDRIKYLGEETEKRHAVEDAVLIRYISKLRSQLAFESMTPEMMAELLIDYWNAIAELYPKCFDEDTKDNYTLLKHTGVASFTYLFPVVYGLCAQDGDISKEGMKKYLSFLQKDLTGKVKSEEPIDPDFLKPVDETWWSRAHGSSLARATSEATFNYIKDQMAKKIQIVAKMKEEGGNV
ncbi:MAG: DGQHR domain-containing protein [Candidatus Bathyarchaeia archaeon]|nr:DGQHR domain-containing protein [Candidatus Bathyarchaeota archaeon]